MRRFESTVLADHLKVFQCALKLYVWLALSQTIRLSEILWKYRNRSCASAAAQVTVRYESPEGCGAARSMAARDSELRDTLLTAGPSATSHASAGRTTGMGIAAMLSKS